MCDRRVHVRVLEYIPGEGDDAEREVVHAHAARSRRGRVQYRRLQERVLPIIECSCVLKGDGDRLVCVERAELEVRCGALVKVPVLRGDTQACTTLSERVGESGSGRRTR